MHVRTKTRNFWHSIAYPSGFLNKNEQRYSINELELIAVVWPLVLFKNLLYGSHVTLQTDHQALLSTFENNRGNETYQSRLTRWVDRLLTFHFEVEHIAGKEMNFADYLSRNPNSLPTGENNDRSHLINTKQALYYTLHSTHRKLKYQKARNTITHNDVKNQSKSKEDRQHGFCHLNSANSRIRFFQLDFKLNKSRAQLLIQNSIPK